MRPRRSSPALVDLFEQVVPPTRIVTRRRMFGYPAAFVNGRFFAGLRRDDFILRLPAAAVARALAGRRASPFEIRGRRMREYVVLPAALLHDRPKLAAQLARSIRFVRSLPPKSTRTSHR